MVNNLTEMQKTPNYTVSTHHVLVYYAKINKYSNKQ